VKGNYVESRVEKEGDMEVIGGILTGVLVIVIPWLIIIRHESQY